MVQVIFTSLTFIFYPRMIDGDREVRYQVIGFQTIQPMNIVHSLTFSKVDQIKIEIIDSIKMPTYNSHFIGDLIAYFV